MASRDVFVLLYLSGIVGCLAQGMTAIVDIVHPDTSAGKVTFCQLQDVIVVRVQTGSDHLTLNLQRNSAVKENTPVYVVRHVGNKTVIVRDTVLNTEGYHEYFDVANMASIEVSCRITSDDKPQYQLDQGRGAWFQSALNKEDYPNNTKIDASNLLPSARDWKNNISGFPENDHVIVFTAYDLYWVEANQTRNLLGLAYVGTICKWPSLSISLVEYTDNLVDDLLVTAHEMGHALSARHDGEYNNTCSGDDRYIMRSSYSKRHNVSITNYFLFSNCSISYFQTFLDRVLATGDTTSRNCLLESLEPVSVTNVTSELPGQLYNVNEQCQMKYGPTSYTCLVGIIDCVLVTHD
ncbi:metalloprotease mig-17-like [Haliotis asinina]|uniref:metalloprotease mig-17-like n=1 Tax=Haliotis asinina TaxID=109174 RepID=UPI003531B0D3